MVFILWICYTLPKGNISVFFLSLSHVIQQSTELNQGKCRPPKKAMARVYVPIFRSLMQTSHKDAHFQIGHKDNILVKCQLLPTYIYTCALHCTALLATNDFFKSRTHMTLYLLFLLTCSKVVLSNSTPIVNDRMHISAHQTIQIIQVLFRPDTVLINQKSSPGIWRLNGG